MPDSDLMETIADLTAKLEMAWQEAEAAREERDELRGHIETARSLIRRMKAVDSEDRDDARLFLLDTGRL